MLTKEQKEQILSYIDDMEEIWELEYLDEEELIAKGYINQNVSMESLESKEPGGGVLGKISLSDLNNIVLEESFMEYLRMLMEERGIEKDSELYNKAGIPADKWSKYKNNGTLPQKEIVMRLALTMELSMYEAEELLKRAGHALRPDQMWDKIIRACIENRFYNMNDIDEFLVEQGLNTVGPVEY